MLHQTNPALCKVIRSISKLDECNGTIYRKAHVLVTITVFCGTGFHLCSSNERFSGDRPVFILARSAEHTLNVRCFSVGNNCGSRRYSIFSITPQFKLWIFSRPGFIWKSSRQTSDSGPSDALLGNLLQYCDIGSLVFFIFHGSQQCGGFSKRCQRFGSSRLEAAWSRLGSSCVNSLRFSSSFLRGSSRVL